MATIKDIARVAGVSHGTVSNVINKRGNVSSHKIRLVEDAARVLGYTANAQAQRLRMDDNRHIAVLLPNLYTQQYCILYTALSQRLQEAGFEVSLHLTHSNARQERHSIAAAVALCPSCIVAVAPTPQATQLGQCGAPVVVVDGPGLPPSESIKHFSFDYQRVAQEIYDAQLSGCHRVAFFGDTNNHSSDRALLGYLQELCRPKGVELVEFAYEHRFQHLGAVEIVGDSQGFDLALATSPERLDTLVEVFSFQNLPLPKLVQLCAKRPTPDDRIACYELDYAHLGSLLAERLTQQSIGQLPYETVFSPVGFRFAFKQVHFHPREQVISLLTIPSPTTQALVKLAPHLKKLTGISLKTTELPYDELHNTLRNFGANNHDLVRMDVVWRPRFERQIFKPLTQFISRPEQLWEKFLPELGAAYKSDYTLPVDPCVQMLLYRKDIFEDATLRRLYYEETRSNLRLPIDYQEFNRIARFFTKSHNPRSPVEWGTVSVFGLSTTAACDFLPRFQSMGGQIFTIDGQMKVDTPPMRRALASYLESMQYTPKEPLYWWSDVMERFMAGRVAMAPVFTNHVSVAVSTQAAVGCAPIPGNKPCLGGGCIGIATTSQKTDACVELLHWIYSEEIGALLTMLGGMTPVASVYQDEQLRGLYPWLEELGRQFAIGSRHHHSPLYPDFDDHRFEVILGMAVRNMAMGIEDMDEALATAQVACDKQFQQK